MVLVGVGIVMEYAKNAAKRSKARMDFSLLVRLCFALGGLRLGQ